MGVTSKDSGKMSSTKKIYLLSKLQGVVAFLGRAGDRLRWKEPGVHIRMGIMICLHMLLNL